MMKLIVALPAGTAALVLLGACSGNVEPAKNDAQASSKSATETIELDTSSPSHSETVQTAEPAMNITDEAVEVVLKQRTNEGHEQNADDMTVAEAASHEPPATTVPPEKRILFFDINKSKVQDKHQSLLDAHVSYLHNHPDVVVNVNGHSDLSGNKRINKVVSKKRADSVADYLIAKGIPAAQIKVNSFGDSLPLTHPEKLDENRRVELHYSEIYSLKE